MIDVTDIQSALDGYLTQHEDLFLIEVEVRGGNLISITVDSDHDSISLDTIMEISRYIEERFDRDVEDYELTVTSAGLTSPLRLPRQYRKYIGEPVIATLRKGGVEKGTLLAADEEGLEMEVIRMEKHEGDKRRKGYPTTLRLSYEEVKSVVYDLKM
ncbi:ribosome assembly cofactor RimP [uncultured Porphyromonas sp.]|uniref:ribosome assembly cofactor RimP n=1 Tax=uncultured Porphyromonas sp. TaxID=159274 RepID=UPI0026168B3A|nr:ribosome assembly cofactor RimP [uncultured Porphyromonas sp.]